MLKFVNAYKEDIWVAYMFLAKDVCGGEGGDWQAIGWYHIAPGGSSVVYANDLDDVNNRYWCCDFNGISWSLRPFIAESLHFQNTRSEFIEKYRWRSRIVEI